MLDFCWCSCVIRVGEPWSCKLCMVFLLHWQTVSENSSYLAGSCCTSTKSRFTGVTTSTIRVFASRVYRYPRAGHCPSHRLRQVPFCTGQLQGILWRAAPLIRSTHVMYEWGMSVSDTYMAGFPFPMQQYAGKTYLTAFVSTAGLIEKMVLLAEIAILLNFQA